jgi:hypothetical protein
MLEDSNERLANWQTQRRPCRDVYPDGCGIYVGPPDWDHRIKKHAEPKHPTPEMALAACQERGTLPAVLKRLGERDELEHGEVRRAARAHPNYLAS